MTERPGWVAYPDWRGASGTVAGRVLVRPEVRDPTTGSRRHILVHVPPALGRSSSARRYPVLYMHDGQNLFDAATGPDAEWQIDETMEALAHEGLEAIVVGIPNAEVTVPPRAEGRALEYTAYPPPDRPGGGADAYLEFLAGTVKPLVDASFPTLPEPRATGIAGSLLGGLISLYAVLARGDVFGFAGVLSPALWFDGGRLLEEAAALRPSVRVYVDVGGREGAHRDTEALRRELSRRYRDDARRLVAQLRVNGFRDGRDLLYVEDPDAVHHETAWAARGPGMLRFLLAPWRRAGP